MIRIVALIGIIWATAAAAQAQEWAEKMFARTSYDFGGVPRSAKVEHRFTLTNLYKEDVHIAGVRTSCNCTSPRVEHELLKTHQQGAVVAAFDTDRFLGQHGATLTVIIDRPAYAEVRLQVKGYIRTDVVLNPSFVAFGSVDQGVAAEKKIGIEYAGRGDWQIVAAKTSSPLLTAEVVPTGRQGGRISYDLVVRLAGTTQPGYINDRVMLITNDASNAEILVAVEGLVVAPLSISPSPLHWGVVEPGASVTRQLVVRGRQPFRIVQVESSDSAVTCKADSDSKLVHIVGLRFTAGPDAMRISGTVRVITDLVGSASVEVPYAGEIAAPTSPAALP